MKAGDRVVMTIAALQRFGARYPWRGVIARQSGASHVWVVIDGRAGMLRWHRAYWRVETVDDVRDVAR